MLWDSGRLEPKAKNLWIRNPKIKILTINKKHHHKQPSTTEHQNQERTRSIKAIFGKIAEEVRQNKRRLQWPDLRNTQIE